MDAGSSSEDGNEVHPIPSREDLIKVDEASEDLEDYDFVTLNYISKGIDSFDVSSNELKTSTINVLTTLEVLENNSSFKIKEYLDEIDNITLIQNETSVKPEENRPTDSATLLIDENSPTISSDQDNQTVSNKMTSFAKSEDDKLTSSVTEGFTKPDLISDNTSSFSQYFDETLLTELEEFTESTVAKTETSTLESGTTETTTETEWFEDYLY